MEKKKIFIFWVGEKEKLEHLFRKEISEKVEFIVGPTESDHQYLMSVSPYYKKSFEIKKFSFCSDVWRVWKLSKEKGIYIDVSVIIGENFLDFVSSLEKYDVALFRGNTHVIETAVMWSGKENNNFYKGMFDIWCDNRALPWNMHFAPSILSVYLYKNYFEFSFDFSENTNNTIAILSLMKIRDKKTIMKMGGDSWSSKKKNYDYTEQMMSDPWESWEKMYANKIEAKKRTDEFYRVKEFGFYEPDLVMVRGLYDTVEKKYLREIAKAAKAIHTKSSVFKSLIWSKIYRILSIKK